MANKLLARTAADGTTIDAFLSVDASAVAGTHYPAGFAHDVTSVANVAVGWTINPDGSVTAPPVSLAALQALQIVTLTGACDIGISSGFISSALGSPHLYPSQDTDQRNLGNSVLASLLPGLPAGWTTPFWCQDPATGAWAFTPHTAVQIQQAGLDGKAAVIAAQNKLIALKAQVAAATTPASVAAIVWA